MFGSPVVRRLDGTRMATSLRTRSFFPPASVTWLPIFVDEVLKPGYTPQKAPWPVLAMRQGNQNAPVLAVLRRSMRMSLLASGVSMPFSMTDAVRANTALGLRRVFGFGSGARAGRGGAGGGGVYPKPQFKNYMRKNRCIFPHP
jgi:hypothetical protein